ncbi:hypothetical protein EBB07_28445 [Paenibacillaceae bacterium]|nr:hypothetical protein EBB07_28445 [Paenibacillaceae bacterium]
MTTREERIKTLEDMRSELGIYDDISAIDLTGDSCSEEMTVKFKAIKFGNKNDYLNILVSDRTSSDSKVIGEIIDVFEHEHYFEMTVLLFNKTFKYDFNFWNGKRSSVSFEIVSGG